MAMKKHEDWLLEQLHDPEFAAEYLTASAGDAEPAVYLRALRLVAQAQGMAKVAAKAGITRESLYRALSAKGNPRWSTLAAVLHATGMKLTVSRAT
jgi:probable addiction module antidote protein